MVHSFYKTLHSQQLNGMKSSDKLGKRKGYHLSIQGIWNGNLFLKKWFMKGQGVRTRGGASPYKTCWVPPPPLLGLCQRFWKPCWIYYYKGRANFELIFFLSKQHCAKTSGRCYLGISGILGMSPDNSLTGFFSFFNMATRKREPMAGLEWKRGQVFHFQNRRVFLLSQGI